MASGQWKDGRVATLRGIRTARADGGFVGFSETGVKDVRVDLEGIDRKLLEAALKSTARHGAGAKRSLIGWERAGVGPGMPERTRPTPRSGPENA